MLINFKKVYQITTSITVDEILSRIKEKAKYQEASTISLLTDSVNFTKLKVNGNLVKYERWFAFSNIFRGFGTITFELSSVDKVTVIKCILDSDKIYWIVGLLLLFCFQLIITAPLLFVGQKDFPVILFTILFVWVAPYIVVLFRFKINKTRLEWYSKEILGKLEIISSS
ncbi:MAG: hypothetical protein NWF06_03000 [Candidatus Bathyarchaeota archaeon]|nr:hypothetical protein [Candidatus Bathyarchaeum sp.]